jgi:hypothetical protein
MTFSTVDSYGTWKELPTADVVYGWLKRRAVVQANIRSLSLGISIEEARISMEKPRDKAVRVVGLGGIGGDDTPVIRLRRELDAMQRELDDLDAEIKMFEFRKDVFKSLSFKERV